MRRLLWVPFLLLLLAVASMALATPVSTVTVVTTGCKQTLNTKYVFYSGRFAFLMWQWGFVATNMDSGQAHWRNGIGKPDAPSLCGTCSSPVVIVGDCWQSVSWLTATPGTPKWVVTVGAPDMCNDTHDESVRGLAVWKFNGTTFQWAGLYRYRDTIRDAPAYLEGDFAYQQQWDRRTTGRCPSSGGLAKRWEKINLNTLTGAGYFCEVPASAQAAQTNIDGYTYTATEQHPTPRPYCALGATQFTLLRSGVILPTETPAPNRSPTLAPPTSVTPTHKPYTPTFIPPTIGCDQFPGGPICTPTPVPATITPTVGVPATATPQEPTASPTAVPSSTPTTVPPTRTPTTIPSTPQPTVVPPTPVPGRTVVPPSTTRPPTITVEPRPTANSGSSSTGPSSVLGKISAIAAIVLAFLAGIAKWAQAHRTAAIVVVVAFIALIIFLLCVL